MIGSANSTRFKPGDYAVARINAIDKKTKKPTLNLVEIVKYDKDFSAYKVKDATGKLEWYSSSKLQATDNDPIVTKSYYEILNLRHQIDELNQKFDSYKNRSFFQRIKEFFTGSK